MNVYKAPPADWDCAFFLSSVHKTGEPYTESFALPLNGVIEHWGQRYASRGPVCANVRANYAEERILVTIAVRADFSLPCSRCLAETGVAISGELRYLFTLRSAREDVASSDGSEEGAAEAEDGDVDVIPIDSFQAELNLSPYVWEVLLLGLPERAHCKEDCKGLCPVCGQNKNERDCGCSTDEIDPRFAVLRDLK